MKAYLSILARYELKLTENSEPDQNNDLQLVDVKIVDLETEEEREVHHQQIQQRIEAHFQPTFPHHRSTPRS